MPSTTLPSVDTRRVLLLLDFQRAALAEPSAKLIEQNALRILEQARNASPLPQIIHVRNAGEEGEPDERYTPGWHLISDPLPTETILDKKKNNAFAGTGLGDLIPPDAEIIVVGFQTDFAIRETCRAALERGNEILLIRGAHGTRDGIDGKPAPQIMLEVEGHLELEGAHLLDMKHVSGLFTDR